MAIRVVGEARVEDNRLVVMIEGDNPEEVMSFDAKRLAIQKAAESGYPRVGINDQTGSFPVDKDGNTYADWNDQSRRGLIKAYRNEIKLMGGL